MSEFINKKNKKRMIALVCTSLGSLLVFTVILLLVNFNVFSKNESSPVEYVDNIFYKSYDVSRLDNSTENEIIKYGHELFINTPKYLGPNNGNQEMVFAGNNLSCNNCHLLAGTKPFSMPLIGIIPGLPHHFFI